MVIINCRVPRITILFNYNYDKTMKCFKKSTKKPDFSNIYLTANYNNKIHKLEPDFYNIKSIINNDKWIKINNDIYTFGYNEFKIKKY
jgi:hypothetical protein